MLSFISKFFSNETNESIIVEEEMIPEQIPLNNVLEKIYDVSVQLFDSIINSTNANEIIEFDYYVLLREYINPCNPYPLKNSLDKQRVIVLNTFRKLILTCQKNDQLYRFIDAFSKQYKCLEDLYLLIFSSLRKKTLLDVFSLHNYKPLYELYGEYIDGLVSILNNVLSILLDIHKLYGVVRITRGRSVKEISFNKFVSDYKSMLKFNKKPCRSNMI